MSAQRLRDILLAGPALLVLSPLLAIGALVVLVADGRPVFFRQRRAGLGGGTFTLVKFRTMTDARDADGRPLPDGERTTRLGRMLRAVRLDELPQLWNVLIGEMSLVGPRPLLPATVARAGERGVRRGTVRPGLTGWAQVNGNTLLSDTEKFVLDDWYVANRSLRLDGAIMARTVMVILRGERVDRTAIGRAYARSPDRRG